MQRLAIFGSTGSIGISTLDVVQRHPDRFTIGALAAASNHERLLEQCIRHRPQVAVLEDARAARALESGLRSAGLTTTVAVGNAALETIARDSGIDTVMAAIVGAAGLGSTLAAASTGKRVLLANKESLVVSGPLLLDAARASGAQLIPIDSEHNAIFQCLPQTATARLAGVRRVLLTASGGPFLRATRAQMATATPEQACAHPRWQMGRKISVDSATLMNKGLELIEACLLFDTEPRQVEVVVHPQSIVHSLVEYVDGSVLAQLGNPDMRTPIAHALGWPERIASGVESLDLVATARLDFEAPDGARFPALALARSAAEAGGTTPATLNAANEVAVTAFLSGRLGFLGIAETIERVLERQAAGSVTSLADVLAADASARALAESMLVRVGQSRYLTMTTVLAFLVAIGVLVAVHEYGHFWMARRVGIRVLRFSIGFGRPLLTRRGADGTEYVLAAIPLGGYVKLLDEREGPVPAAEVKNAYNRKPVWQRVLVLLAGPFANFAFAVLAYWVLFIAGIPALKPVLGEITAGSIAAQAGLVPGDEIVAVGSHATPTREAAVLTILDQMMDGESVPLSIRDHTGHERQTALRIGGGTRALTEPGALLPGLGFDFWYPEVPAVVGTADEGTPAHKAGLQSGDRIVGVDGHPIADFKGLVDQVQPNPGKSLLFRVERAGREFDVRIEIEAQRDGERLVGRIGVRPASVSQIPAEMRTSERYAPLNALAHATGKTWDMSALTARMLWNVVTGDVSVKNLSGPINIAEYAGTSARQGVLAFLSFLAIVSVSLFVLNLLPIPILDGGQIVYQLAELAKGSPLSERTQAVGQQIGIVLLLVLMSFAFYNDLSRLFS